MADHQVAAQAALFQCKSCEREVPPSGFYASNLSRCKECVKAGVRANRADKIDYYRLYDRRRYRDDDARKENARKSSASPAGVKSRVASIVRMKEAEPEKYRARNAVSNALRDGKIKRADGCFFCGDGGKLHAHHHDYSKPLDVFWLCPPCHGKLHVVNGDFHRPRMQVSS
jgi:hypothetical protein